MYILTFTFQYVSIISLPNALCTEAFEHLHSNMFLLFHEYSNVICCFTDSIYIPICFYYFGYTTSRLRQEKVLFTFQYVSIISNLMRNKIILTQHIYIPICFYYFFLQRAISSATFLIYIPICFYYFVDNSENEIRTQAIYIPICFYYFLNAKLG